MVTHLHLAGTAGTAGTAGARGRELASATLTAPINVVVAADHPFLRHGLRQLLDVEADVEVLGEAGVMSAVVQQALSLEPHVLVLDRGMSEGSSVAAIEDLRELAPQTEVVVLTAEDRPMFVQRALAAGALGLVAKDRAEDELAQAVRSAARGSRYVSPRLAGGMEDMQRSFTDDKLTPREVEVLGLIALGHTSVEIARKLSVSPRTIETHRAHIHKKLALDTRAELVRYALRRGLLRA